MRHLPHFFIAIFNMLFLACSFGHITSAAEQTEGDSNDERTYAALPFEITSFGAARIGDTAYVYGGHTGDAHSYSLDEQSDKLLALDLKDPAAKWKVAATGPKLQGLGMAAHGKRLIVVGGFTAKNEIGEEHDLHSQSKVLAFDTEGGKWSDLPSLPEGRSSHDAAIVGDSLYVVGGWTMAGEKETQWHSTALSLDLSQENAQWQGLPSPDFQVRAIAAAPHDGRLFVVGGMKKAGGPTRQVHIFEPETQQWLAGPDLPGAGPMAGFGAAAWSVDGKLIASTYEGNVLRLDDDGKSWIAIGKSDDSRFFHRLIPLATNSLLAVGGANMDSGKFLDVEVLKTN